MYQARYTDGSTLLIQVTSVKIPVVPLKEKKKVLKVVPYAVTWEKQNYRCYNCPRLGDRR